MKRFNTKLIRNSYCSVFNCFKFSTVSSTVANNTDDHRQIDTPTESLKNWRISKRELVPKRSHEIQQNFEGERNFFGSETSQIRETWQQLTNESYLHIKLTLNDFVDLSTNKITKALSKDYRKALYRFPGAAKQYNDFDALLRDDLVLKWWTVFSAGLKWTDPVTLEPMYNTEEISRALNSLIHFIDPNIGTKALDKLGEKAVRKFIEAILDGETVLRSRSVAMLMRNFYKLLELRSPLMADSKIKTIVATSTRFLTEITVPDWMGSKLNKFLLKFYADLPTYVQMHEHELYVFHAKENVINALYYAVGLGARTPSDATTLKYAACLFGDVLIRDDPHWLSMKPRIRLTWFSKALRVCVSWNFDFGRILGTLQPKKENLKIIEADANDKFWHKIFASVAEAVGECLQTELNEKTLFLNYTLCNALLVTLKYDLEPVFLAHFKHLWTRRMHSGAVVNSSMRKMVAVSLRNNPNKPYHQRAKEFSDFYVFEHVIDLINSPNKTNTVENDKRY